MTPRSSLLVACCAVLVAAVLAVAPLGAQGREWSLPGLDGGQLRSADVQQGATVIVVWAGWSPRCRDIGAQVERVKEIVGGRARVVTVDFQESRAEVREFLAQANLRAPVYLDEDGSFSKDHRISTLPGLVVYRDGEVSYQGRLPDDLRAALDGAL